MKIMRVFPRRTRATPDDNMVRIAEGPGLFDSPGDIDEVHVSVTFTWDMPLAKQLSIAWSKIAPTFIGGPATGIAGGNFEPGMYLKQGYVITSRGCPNSCWFCSVWKREGHDIKELPIVEGWNVLDDNLLACSDSHISAVFDMLELVKIKYHRRIEFTGGLEAARLQNWHIDRLRKIRPEQMFFAYDTPDDLEPLRDAGRRLFEAGWAKNSHRIRAYVLCGYPGDTFGKAEKRMHESIGAGFYPMAMLYRGEYSRAQDRNWKRFQRIWARPAIINSKIS